MKNTDLWKCPADSRQILDQAPQVIQKCRLVINANDVRPYDPPNISDDHRVFADYWMWGFDKKGKSVSLDNFWSKTEAQILADLQRMNAPLLGFSRTRVQGFPSSVEQVELIGDPYFPLDSGSKFAGVAPHVGHCRNVGFLDGHGQYIEIHSDKDAGPRYLGP